MPWLLVDVALVLLALVAAVLCALRLWTGVKRLSGELGRAGSAIGAATEALAVVQGQSPPSAGAAVPRPPSPRTLGPSTRLPGGT